MKNKNRVIILTSIIVGVLVVTLGLTYAVLTFNETKGNGQLVLGDIWMHYGETNQINLQNAIPTESYIPNGYFEFTVDGKNTYTKKDIWYEIVLNHGDEHATRTTRIRDDLLKFRLVEVNNNVETELFTNKSYSSLTNKRIWVDTISKNTTSEITKTYRLYMWISNDTKVGNTSDSDYDNETWNEDVYGSIKVSVTGDFNEKELAYEDIYNVTDASCFTTNEKTFFGVNPVMKEQSVEDANELSSCVAIYESLRHEFDEGSNAESFCKGTGTVRGGRTIEDDLAGWITDALTNNYDFLESGGQILLDFGIIIPNGDTYIVNPVMQNQTVEDINELTKCAFYFYGRTDEGSDSETFCQGTGTIWDGMVFSDYINSTLDENLTYLQDSNIIYLGFNVAITDYDISCGTDVVIPKNINNNIVTEVGLYNKGLTSLVIPNTIKEIKRYGFYGNELESLIFEKNSQLESINQYAFAGNNQKLTEVIIPDSVSYLTCDAFNSNVTIIKNENLTCTPMMPPV